MSVRAYLAEWLRTKLSDDAVPYEEIFKRLPPQASRTTLHRAARDLNIVRWAHGHTTYWAMPIRCDYCHERATHLSSEGDPDTRRFRCEAHYITHASGFLKAPPPLPMRSRLEDYTFEEVARRMRAQTPAWLTPHERTRKV